jgi:hypothetical protein
MRVVSVTGEPSSRRRCTSSVTRSSPSVSLSRARSHTSPLVPRFATLLTPSSTSSTRATSLGTLKVSGGVVQLKRPSMRCSPASTHTSD